MRLWDCIYLIYIVPFAVKVVKAKKTHFKSAFFLKINV